MTAKGRIKKTSSLRLRGEAEVGSNPEGCDHEQSEVGSNHMLDCLPACRQAGFVGLPTPPLDAGVVEV